MVWLAQLSARFRGAANRIRLRAWVRVCVACCVLRVQACCENRQKSKNGHQLAAQHSAAERGKSAVPTEPALPVVCFPTCMKAGGISAAWLDVVFSLKFADFQGQARACSMAAWLTFPHRQGNWNSHTDRFLLPLLLLLDFLVAVCCAVLSWLG